MYSGLQGDEFCRGLSLLISQNIDREVREELVTIFWEPMRIDSVLSGLSFNLFANMKF